MSVAQVGNAFDISFTVPTHAEDGERLTKLLEFEVLRSVAPPNEKSKPATPALSPWISFSEKDLARNSNSGKRTYVARLSDQEFNRWQGATFRFGLRTLTRGFRRRPVQSELSNPAETILLDVSGSVRNVAIKPTEKAILLQWSPPDRSLGNRPVSNLSGYQIYRSATGQPESFNLLGESSSASYEDKTFLFGRTYYYKIRVVFKEDGTVAESEDSRVLPFTPRDTFPPAPPVGLSAVYAGQMVDLIWTANAEPDLAGYNVYRREKDGQPLRLNRDLMRTPIFRDTSVEPGKEYFYKVTAIDLANNESPPSEEAAIETR